MYDMYVYDIYIMFILYIVYTHTSYTLHIRLYHTYVYDTCTVCVKHA